MDNKSASILLARVETRRSKEKNTPYHVIHIEFNVPALPSPYVFEDFITPEQMSLIQLARPILNDENRIDVHSD